MRLLRFLALMRLFRSRRRPHGYYSPFGTGGGGYGRRRYRRGAQVRVVGCGPGCLMTSLLLSIGLTILVNVLIRLF